MAVLQFQKVNTVPASGYAADTVYIVKDGNNVRLYVSDSTGTNLYPVIDSTGLNPFLLMGANDA